MNYVKKLCERLEQSLTAYHAVDRARQDLEDNGFVLLDEGGDWQLKSKGKYMVVKDGSALIAFVVGEDCDGYNVIASHTDSPCLKLKYNPVVVQNGYVKLNVEKYGGMLLYSMLDVPLAVAGRVVVSQQGKIRAQLYKSDSDVVIPSLAVHMNRAVNDGLSLNPQTDLMPLCSLDESFRLPLPEGTTDYDLFVTCNVKPRLYGFDNEFLLSPRIDNLTSVFASVDALCVADPKNVAVIYLSDNEEVGSNTKQGADSPFLFDTLRRIAARTNRDFDKMLANSFMLSVDNAHAVHPNFAVKSDPTNNVVLGKGIAIKHHANQNYTTDAMSSAVVTHLAAKEKLPVQHFFMRSDMPCGGTLGAISSAHLPIRSADIGLPQLAMHSACESMAVSDYGVMIDLLKIFIRSKINYDGYDGLTVE